MKEILLIAGGLAAAYMAYRYSNGKSLIPSSMDDVYSDFGSAPASGTPTSKVEYPATKTLGDYISGAITSTASDTTKIIKTTGNAIVTIGGAAYSSAANIASGISKVGYATGKTLGDVYNATVAPIAKTISDVASSLASTAQSVLSRTATAVGGAVQNISSSIGKTLGDVYSWLKG